jgi:hypothetical protein
MRSRAFIPEGPPKNEAPPRQGRQQRLSRLDATLDSQTRLVKRRHPFRWLLAKLPLGLDRLAWLGLPNPKRDGWKEEL